MVKSKDLVVRDQFYNGNFKHEHAAVVLRLAKSWFRFGSLEILASSKEFDLLRVLTDFIIEHHFPHISLSSESRYLELFSDIVENTAHMVARWQSVGFTHGVMNTDNFSILSITIDYGPFGFLDEYNPKFVPNTSDDEGRYSYEKQPDVARFNLDKLREALLPLLNHHQASVMETILNGFDVKYKYLFMKIFRRKLGLFENQEEDEELVAYFLHMMERTQADFTISFRNLADWTYDDMVNSRVPKELWALKIVSGSDLFGEWTQRMIRRQSASIVTESERRQEMRSVNPRYVLRNWIAQLAIEYAEADDGEFVSKVLSILSKPFQEQQAAEALGFSNPPPAFAKNIKVSCSS